MNGKSITTCSEVVLQVILSQASGGTGLPYRLSTASMNDPQSGKTQQLDNASNATCDDEAAACGGYQGAVLPLSGDVPQTMSVDAEFVADTATYPDIPASAVVTISVNVKEA